MPLSPDSSSLEWRERIESKLDSVYDSLAGKLNEPGLLQRVNSMSNVLMGKEDQLGLVHKVAFMWRFHVYILCGVSAVIGSISTAAVLKYFHLLAN